MRQKTVGVFNIIAQNIDFGYKSEPNRSYNRVLTGIIIYHPIKTDVLLNTRIHL